MRLVPVPVIPLFLLVAAGCGGDVATDTTGVPPINGSPGQPTPEASPTPEHVQPAQLSITRFEVASSRQADVYEPNDTQAFYLGPYGYQYIVNGAVISPTTLAYTVEVSNSGAPVVAPFEVDFYRDAASAPVNQLGDERQRIDQLPSGASAELRFEVKDAEPGQVRSWSVIDVANAIPETDEDDNTSEAVQATVTPDVDVFSVFQTAGKTIRVQVDQLPADYDVELVNQNGAILARGQNDGTAAEDVTVTASADGTYFVRVFGFANARNTQPYRLRVTVP